MKQHQRGLTFISVLLLLGVAAGVFWVLTFGSAYWENQQVNSTLHEAANLCYREHDDATVRQFIMRKLQQQFGQPGQPDKPLSIDLDPEDLRIERTESPKHVDIWLTYSRTVKTPFVDQERTVTFSDHADQDLSDVKW